MTMRPPLLALLLLAACSGPRPAADAASADTRTPPAADSSRAQAATAAGDLPDFADPRRFLDRDSLRWAQWETARRADHVARLQALGIRPIRSDSTGPREAFDTASMEGYDPYGERASDYHFIDFSGDGVDDVIYSGGWYVRNENGFGALEGSHFKLYQVMNGRAVEVMDHHGTVQRIFRGRPGEPLSFRAVHHGCCADPEWSLDYYRPVRGGDTVRFEGYRVVMAREGVQLPASFLPRPRPFTVNADRYLLRDSPAIDDAAVDEKGEDWHRWAGHGNALAEYGRGARGIAIAERTDATGRVWWFVRMDGGTPPRDAQRMEEGGDGPPVDRLGWMSSRFLTPAP